MASIHNNLLADNYKFDSDNESNYNNDYGNDDVKNNNDYEKDSYKNNDVKNNGRNDYDESDNDNNGSVDDKNDNSGSDDDESDNDDDESDNDDDESENDNDDNDDDDDDESDNNDDDESDNDDDDNNDNNESNELSRSKIIKKSDNKTKQKNSLSYPTTDDKDFQYKIYTKREFYYFKRSTRPKLTNYNELADYRKSQCKLSGDLLEHQALLSNFMNPNTPYMGLILVHGTGTGKCVKKDTTIKFYEKNNDSNNNNNNNTNNNNNNNNKFTLQISEIWDKYKTEEIADNEAGVWSTPSKELYVTSYDEINGSFVQKKVLHLYKQKINSFLYKITFESGKTITKTFVHKLLKIKNNDANNLPITFSFTKGIAIPSLIPSYVWSNNIKVNDICITIDSKNDSFNNGLCCNDDNNIIIYDKVISVEQIIYNDYVYDLEVEHLHNFVANSVLCHNTFAGLAITEGFKTQVTRYKTFIYIIVPAPLKEQWKQAIITGFGKEYIKSNENQLYMTDDDKEKLRKQGIANAMTIYKIMSFNSFKKRVIGERIIERQIIGNKLKLTYRKTDTGDFERDIAGDIIHSLDNTIIVIDEAHNLTGNTLGEALMRIKKASVNLRILLLTATPMKNKVSDIVELINVVRPDNSPILKEKLFNKHTNHLEDFKEGGIEYLKKMTNGYISYIRGADPITFANKIEMGVKPKNLLFTKVTQCIMGDYQEKAYLEAEKDVSDHLDKKMGSVANLVIPILDSSRKKIIFTYGKTGINQLKNQLKTNYEKINELVAKDVLKITSKNDLNKEYINISDKTNNITGAIFKREYLHLFSTKFAQALNDITNYLFSDNDLKESRSGFCYSNLVVLGIEIFKEILLQNGYLEFNTSNGKTADSSTTTNYQINDDTICYNCGKQFINHNKEKHHFYPATFLVITGAVNDLDEIYEPEDKRQYIKTVFNTPENKNGKLIKLVLGSQVLTEGINIFNTYCVFILDVYFNFGRVDQIVGRAIRHCSHYELMNEKNVFPNVRLFKYVAILKENAKKANPTRSAEEDLYYKAEMKFLPIKKAERAMAINAIDCPLNRSGNIFEEEIIEFKDCIEPNESLLQINIAEGKPTGICPAKCNFTKCDYKCENVKLNALYYDPNRIVYKVIDKDKLDYSTFTNTLAKNEINYAKKKIKELFMIGYIYNFNTINAYVYSSYNKDKKELFDEFFVQKALDELIPVTENDFNNFTDVIYDKLFKTGYLIYLNGYYIFQPFDGKENTPLYYRTTYDYVYKSNLSLQTYINNVLEKDVLVENEEYNFDDVQDYYDNKPDFDYVGIIDKDNKLHECVDVFKIREKRDKFLEKKRGVGIPSLKGSVCATSKTNEYLEFISKKLKINANDLTSRESICSKIKHKLFELEKYSKGNNKKTYLIIPKNHPVYEFPLNLEDKASIIKQKLQQIIPKKLKNYKEKEEDVDAKENKNCLVKHYKIEISFSIDDLSNSEENNIKKLGFEEHKGKWIKILS